MSVKAKNDIWLKASVVGGLWASMEIIVGSFLHNTRLPFAGSILAFAGTVLLIGFYQIWPQRGLIIRAGFITAIMKSVSPSAIILGPMTGILLEAVLIEFVLLILGNNIVSVSVAGIFSLSSALLHKIISVSILYGFDILKVYINIINFALKQVGLKEASPLEILFALLSVYVVFGIAAGITGFVLGKKSKHLKQEISDEILKEGVKKKEFFVIDDKNKTNIYLLWVNILAIPFGLYLFNVYGMIPGTLFASVYSIVAGYYYAKNLRRLKKPVFWSQLVIIVVITTLFWKTDGGSVLNINMQGFKAGVEMMIRAIFIVIAFTGLSVELKSEKVKSFLTKIGMGRFYESMRLAFGALPQMIALLPSMSEIIKKPVDSFLKPLVYADSWLEMFKNK